MCYRKPNLSFLFAILTSFRIFFGSIYRSFSEGSSWFTWPISFWSFGSSVILAWKKPKMKLPQPAQMTGALWNLQTIGIFLSFSKHHFREKIRFCRLGTWWWTRPGARSRSQWVDKYGFLVDFWEVNWFIRTITGWWFGTWLLWLSIIYGNFIIPIDELHHFSEG